MNNIISIPIMLIIHPNIFNPFVASFWSPKPNIFFAIIRASYTKITPINTIITAINFIIIFNILILLLLDLFFIHFIISHYFSYIIVCFFIWYIFYICTICFYCPFIYPPVHISYSSIICCKCKFQIIILIY